jgi:hypothetical protein
MAPVGFMFERKGHVRVVFPANDHLHLESIIEQTLGVADDFDEVRCDSETIELKVNVNFGNESRSPLNLQPVYLSASKAGNACCSTNSPWPRT